MLMQPFVNYNMRHGWYLVSSPIITSNWEASNNRWTVPVGGGVGRIVHFGKLPVNAYTQFFRNVERPDGTTSWSARFQMQFLFPRGEREQIFEATTAQPKREDCHDQFKDSRSNTNLDTRGTLTRLTPSRSSK
jgi:hypothetical protein